MGREPQTDGIVLVAQCRAAHSQQPATMRWLVGGWYIKYTIMSETRQYNIIDQISEPRGIIPLNEAAKQHQPK